jgi:hypothetical protein
MEAMVFSGSNYDPEDDVQDVLAASRNRTLIQVAAARLSSSTTLAKRSKIPPPGSMVRPRCRPTSPIVQR